MDKSNSKVETMVHPFNGTVCEVKRLQPGELIEPGDMYRSVTLQETRSALGRWFMVDDLFAGTIVGKECNVNFIRLTPTADNKVVELKNNLDQKQNISHY